jgi:chromosome segregation ATPase
MIPTHDEQMANLAEVIAEITVTLKSTRTMHKWAMRRIEELKAQVESGNEERVALFTENASLRTEIYGLESLIHRLADDRSAMRGFMRRHTLAWKTELSEAHEATEDDLRTITNLRRAIRSMLAGASTRDLRRKLQAIAERVMKA